MKHLFIIALLAMCSVLAQAGITTYEFTSVNWAARCGGVVCDGQTDGFVCDLPASDVGTARTSADGRLMYAGVGVKTGTSGAGATSVKSFTRVRQLTFNFCQNSSRGRGVIYVQVGAAPVDSIVVNRPASSGAGIYNRDSVIRLSEPASGPVRFWISCSENGIYLHSLSIRAEEGGSTPFTQASYRMVTDASQLRDSNQIIIGVPAAGRIMGYFDESVSQNNIHSLPGSFSADGQTVQPTDEAIYTLRTAELDGRPCFYIQDELRYGEAFLVASGGQTKNRLALWDHLYDADTYGHYGYWDITVGPDGQAVIRNLGRSRSTYLQYNAANSPTLFSCYAQQGSQTPVSIYRRTEALGDVEAIVAPMLSFGTLLMDGPSLEAERSLLVQANRLTDDIRVSVDNPLFQLSDTVLDRDGDRLTVRLSASEPGRYAAVLTFRSGSVVASSPVLAVVVSPLTVAQAAALPDYSFACLDEVEVTKKFDRYIFVRDASGSMLLYDGGDGLTGTRYGSGLRSGDKLSRVQGRVQDYFGVPELSPTASFSVSRGSADAVPEIVTTALDSSDVCRFVRLDGVVVSESMTVEWQGRTLPVVDVFDTGITAGVRENLSAIVMLSWNELQLWLVSEEPVVSGLEENVCSSARKRMIGGILCIERNGRLYSAEGKLLK